MVTNFFDILDAFRADSSGSEVEEHAQAATTWLTLGSCLQNSLGLSPQDRRLYLERAVDVVRVAWKRPAELPRVSPDDHSWLTETVAIIADDAEQEGAFAVSMTLLDLGLAVVPETPLTRRGRLVWQQARVLRKIGEVDRAEVVLRELREESFTKGDVGLLALCWIGLGAVARVRGNYPAARKAFSEAVSLAPAVDARLGVARHAHHGLLIAAAVAGDFDTALRHGMIAVQNSDSDAERAEILTSLATACLDAGEPRAALHAFLQVLSTTAVPRIRMGAIGGAAIAAARLENVSTVVRLAECARGMLQEEQRFAHELADMSRELFEAFLAIGDAVNATRYRREAEQRAGRHGFHEIVHQIEQAELRARKASPRIMLGDEALGIVHQLAEGDEEELLLAATSYQGMHSPPGVM